MSNYIPMPSPELQAAMDWLQELRNKELRDDENKHVSVLYNTLRQRLLPAYEEWYIHQCYRDFTRERNELAKRLFVESFDIEQSPSINWEVIVERCLLAANCFLTLSGEKMKKKEDIEERLRDVLGWKP